MANSWGRGGTSGGQPSGIGGMVFAIVISLVLGAGGGYGLFRAIMPDNTAEFAAVRAERDRLGEQVERQKSELDGLATKLAETEPNTQMVEVQQAKIAALREQLEKAMSGGEEAAIATRRQLLEEVSAAEAARDRATTESAALRQQFDELQQQRDSAIAEGKDALDGLRRQVEAQLAEAERDRNSAEAEKVGLEQQVAQLRGGADSERTALRQQLSELQQDTIPALQKAVEQRQAESARLKTEADRLQAGLVVAEGAARDAKHQLEAANRQLVRLEAKANFGEMETKRLQAEIAALRGQPVGDDAAAVTTTETAPAVTTTTQPAVSAQPTVPRDASDVEAALRRAPGLDGLSELARLRLQKKLTAGECVTTSLESVFERVPVISLRNLIRDLKSNC